MAIDKSQKHWHGNSSEDIIEYLDGYSESEKQMMMCNFVLALLNK